MSSGSIWDCPYASNVGISRVYADRGSGITASAAALAYRVRVRYSIRSRAGSILSRVFACKTPQERPPSRCRFLLTLFRSSTIEIYVAIMVSVVPPFADYFKGLYHRHRGLSTLLRIRRIESLPSGLPRTRLLRNGEILALSRRVSRGRQRRRRSDLERNAGKKARSAPGRITRIVEIENREERNTPDQRPRGHSAEIGVSCYPSHPFSWLTGEGVAEGNWSK